MTRYTPERQIKILTGQMAGWRQRAVAAEMLVEELREYLREKNEIIKAYAGPKGMTPEDVAFAISRQQPGDAKYIAALQAEITRLRDAPAASDS